MKNKLPSITLLLALFFAAVAPISRVEAKAVQSLDGSVGNSTEGLINPDGTLNLDTGFSGALDLSGYRVDMDLARGPILSPAQDTEAAAPATGQWGALGGIRNAFNDYVYAIAVSGADIYVGGNFTDANGIPAADYIVKWNGEAWSALGSDGANNGSLNNFVDAIAVNGSDVYVGGLFNPVNDGGVILTKATYVAKWDGSHWSALGNDGAGGGALNGGVRTLLADGTDLYVGGDFLDAGGVNAADYIAKWNGTNWSALSSNSAGDGSLNSYVSALAMDSDGKLYVGGNFTDVAGPIFTLLTADYIAEFDSGGWANLGYGASGNGSLNGEVLSIAVSGSNLYVGGYFTDVANGSSKVTAADCIAKWNGTAWSALGNNGSSEGSLSGLVYAITVDASGNVYAGGGFLDIKNSDGNINNEADFVAKWDGTSWSALGNDGNGNGALGLISYNYPIRALAMSGTKVYVGGIFSVNNNGTALAGKNLAIWDQTNWRTLAAANTDGALNSMICAIAIDGANVYVGGDFTDVANGANVLHAAGYIAKWDGQNWSALGSDGHGGPSLNDWVYDIAIQGTDIYVGGYFKNVNNNGVVLPEADSIAKWDTLTGNWSAVGSDGNGDGAIKDTVKDIHFIGTDLYAGGHFTDVTSNGHTWYSADYIARWDGSDWLPLLGNGNGNGSLNSIVETLTSIGTDLYVGGSFTDVNNGGTVLQNADYVAKWDGSTWSALGNNGAPDDGSLNDTVYALATDGSNLYVGGRFNNVNNNGATLYAADKIAKWDTLTENWSALGHNSSGNGVFSGTGYWISTIVVNGSNIYVGGNFWDLEDTTTLLDAADYVAKWNGSHWSALGSGDANGGALSSPANRLAVGNNGATLYVGGSFDNVNNNGIPLPAADNIAAYGLSPITTSIKSTGTQDGWVLESGEKTNKGGTMNTSATSLRLGDDAVKKQYRTVLSFSTKGLPDNAVINKVTLKLKKQGITGGGNPVTTFQGFIVDIKKGTFGAASLQTADFQTAANKSVGPFKPALVGSWYSINLTSAAAQINKLATNSGITQIRLRFKLDDNNNTVANYLSLYSGNAPTASRPQLIVEYYVP